MQRVLTPLQNLKMQFRYIIYDLVHVTNSGSTTKEFLPCDMNLFKVTTNKEENCMNVFIPISEKLFIAGDSNERKLSFISFINLDSNELGGGGGGVLGQF